MFLDIAWSEILVIGVVAVVAIGPKELPQVMRTLGRLVRRGQYLKYALSQQFEDFMREHELEELRKGLKPGETIRPGDLEHAMMTGVNFEARRNAVDAETDEEGADEDFSRSLPPKDDEPS
jgi:sec-independent protein translocase protein TatB